MITVSHVSKCYNPGKPNACTALSDLCFDVEDGEYVAIMGTSGVGKSTLLYCISGLEPFESGEISVDGTEIGTLSDSKLAALRNRAFGIVMQDYALIEEFTVFENVSLALCFAKGKTNRKKRVSEVLQKVGIEDLSQKLVRELSGGQKQRAAIARALVNHPNYLLADEPTGALDSGTTGEILNLFGQLNREGQTILLVTHDPAVAASCKRVVVLKDGKLEET